MADENAHAACLLLCLIKGLPSTKSREIGLSRSFERYPFLFEATSSAMDTAACVWLVLAYAACLILWAAVCKMYYSICGEFGKGLVTRQFGQHSFHVVSGDYSSELVYKEIFLKRVYFHHGVCLDDRRGQPLVLDVGGHLGFFSAFVAEHYKDSRQV